MATDTQCPLLIKNLFTILEDEFKYMCVLNLADVTSNCNKSCIMQLLHRKLETYVIYTRSGRVGQTGQINTDFFVDKDCAIAEFEKLFYDKTGVEWKDRYSGDTKPGKYQYILTECDKELVVDGALDNKLSEFIDMIYSPALYKTFNTYDFDTTKLPLGSLSPQQIDKAKKILQTLNTMFDTVTGNMIEGMESEVNDLSSQFYTAIPSANPKIRPLVSRIQLEEKGDLLSILNNMCYISKNGLGDSYNKYKKLETNISHLDDANMFNIIQNYVNTNVGHNFKLSIVDIFSIEKPSETQAYRKWNGLHNKQLLWHGTRMANAVGILTTGLLTHPQGVPISGKMFGNGVYFSNCVTKSAQYMGIVSGRGLIFLCEVALGNSYELTNAVYVTCLPNGKHSTKGVGRMQPNTDSHVEIDDVVIPIGKMQDVTSSKLNFDEYIVYDKTQIKLRYVVVVNKK